MSTNAFTIRVDKIKYLTEKEILSLLSHVKSKSIRDYAIFLTGYLHGLRISEVQLLQLADWTPENRRLYIHRIKGGISASYRVHDDLAKAIVAWLKIRGTEEGPLYVSRQGYGISKRQLDTLFKEYSSSKEVNLAKDKQHFHTLRHSVSVHMVDKDIPLVQIKDWLGHRDIKSTMVYANVSDKKRDETASRFYENKKKEDEKEKGKIKVNWKMGKK